MDFKALAILFLCAMALAALVFLGLFFFLLIQIVKRELRNERKGFPHSRGKDK